MTVSGNTGVHAAQVPNGKLAGTARRPLLNLTGAEQYSGFPAIYLTRLRRERRIPVVKIGSKLFFEPDDLDRLILASREEAIAGPLAVGPAPTDGDRSDVRQPSPRAKDSRRRRLGDDPKAAP